MPATVQAVLAARIDRLPPEEKRLLQTAAVIGTEVPLPCCRPLPSCPRRRCTAASPTCRRPSSSTRRASSPSCDYTFKHALTHEVAYGSLLQERRRALHARIVEALEALAGDRVAEQVERLAHHALRGEVWDKALAYGRQAGEKAMARSAHREAVGYFEQALSALPHLPETRDTREQAIDLRLALRTALRPSGDFGRILASLREAEALAAALDDPRRLGQVSVFLSVHFRLMGAYDQAIAAAQRALALATASGDVVLHALANQLPRPSLPGPGRLSSGDRLPRADRGVPRRGAAPRALRPGLPARRALPCLPRLVPCRAGHVRRGQGPRGRRAADCRGGCSPREPHVASQGIGLLALRQGDLPRALPLLERAVGLCQDADLPLYFPWMAAALGAAYTLAGRVADAVPLLTQAMEQTTATETVGYQALCRLSLGEAQLLAGRLEEAHALAERALALAREHQERGHQAYALRLLGDIAARREPPESDQAEAHYRQALALAEELGMRPLQAHCHLGLGTLYAKTRPAGAGPCRAVRPPSSCTAPWT